MCTARKSSSVWRYVSNYAESPLYYSSLVCGHLDHRGLFIRASAWQTGRRWIRPLSRIFPFSQEVGGQYISPSQYHFALLGTMDGFGSSPYTNIFGVTETIQALSKLSALDIHCSTFRHPFWDFQIIF